MFFFGGTVLQMVHYAIFWWWCVASGLVMMFHACHVLALVVVGLWSRMACFCSSRGVLVVVLVFGLFAVMVYSGGFMFVCWSWWGVLAVFWWCSIVMDFFDDGVFW